MALLLNIAGKDLVLAWINRDNNLSLTLEQVEFSPPEALVVDPGLNNTRLVVSSKPGMPFSGDDTVTYLRLNIDEIIKEQYRILYVPDLGAVESTHDLIPHLNAQLGLQFEASDIIDEPVDTAGELPIAFTLKMAAGSYAWLGEVPMNISAQLADLITVNLLTGLQYPVVPEILQGGAIVSNDGNLHAGSGIAVSKLLRAANEELEILLGGHRRATGQVGYVNMFDPVDGDYAFTLDDDKFWNWSFGLALYDTGRGDNILDLYDVTMLVEHEGQSLVFTLIDNPDHSRLCWEVAGISSINDSQPTETYAITSNSQQTRWYAQAFPINTPNTAGALLGTWTFTITAEPKNAVYLNPVVISTNVTVTPSV